MQSRRSGWRQHPNDHSDSWIFFYLHHGHCRLPQRPTVNVSFPHRERRLLLLILHRYMAKAPSSAAAFDGSGQVWFKILDLGPTFDASGTATWPLARMVSTKLSCLTPADLRCRNIHLHNPQSTAKRRLPAPRSATRHP